MTVRGYSWSTVDEQVKRRKGDGEAFGRNEKDEEILSRKQGEKSISPNFGRLSSNARDLLLSDISIDSIQLPRSDVVETKKPKSIPFDFTILLSDSLLLPPIVAVFSSSRLPQQSFELFFSSSEIGCSESDRSVEIQLRLSECGIKNLTHL